MIKTVLIAIDGSGFAARALKAAADLASKYGAKLVILTVLPDGQLPAELAQYISAEGEYVGEVTERILDQAEETARELGVENIARLDEEGDPAATILRAARESNADIIVMGHRGLGRMTELLLGSISHKVSQLAGGACMIVR